MPWLPELFSVPVLQRLQEKWQRELVDVPFFDGLLAGEFDALVESLPASLKCTTPFGAESGVCGRSSRSSTN